MNNRLKAYISDIKLFILFYYDCVIRRHHSKYCKKCASQMAVSRTTMSHIEQPRSLLSHQRSGSGWARFSLSLQQSKHNNFHSQKSLLLVQRPRSNSTRVSLHPAWLFSLSSALTVGGVRVNSITSSLARAPGWKRAFYLFVKFQRCSLSLGAQLTLSSSHAKSFGEKFLASHVFCN